MNEPLDIQIAKDRVLRAQNELAAANDRVAELEAEPGIVTFEADVYQPGICQPQLHGNDLEPFNDQRIHVAVSRKPFLSYQGIEVARAEIPKSGSEYPLWYRGSESTFKFFAQPAKPGNLIVIVDGGVKTDE